MSPVAVAADSTTYLPRELASREGVTQISLYVGWEGESSRELDLPSFDAFYERLRTDPELPTTSQPSIGDFLAAWEPLLDAGDEASEGREGLRERLLAWVVVDRHLDPERR